MPTHSAPEFPSISSLFSQTWETFKKSILRLFIFDLLSFAVIVGVIIVFILVLIFSGVSIGVLFSGKTPPNPSVLLPIILSSGIFVLIGILFFILMGSFVQAGNIFIVGNSGNISLGSTIKQSIRLSFPFFITSLIIFFLVAGGFLLFIIPGIVIGLFLSFTLFEVVLGEKKYLSALRSSTAMVSSHFWEIFARIIILWIISFAITSIHFWISIILGVGNAFSENSVSNSLTFSIINGSYNLIYTIISTLVGWFSFCYTLTLYKQAKAAQKKDKSGSILWMGIVSIIGWVLCIIFSALILAFISSLISNQMAKSINKYQDMNISSDTVNHTLNPEAKEHYNTALKILRELHSVENNSLQFSSQLDKAIQEAKTAVDLDPSYPYSWSLLGDAYSWKSDIQSFEKSISAYKQAQKLDPNNERFLEYEANILIKMKQYDQAILLLQKALRLPETNSRGNTYYSLGIAYSYLGLIQETKSNFNSAIQAYQKYNTDGEFDDEILSVQKDLADL